MAREVRCFILALVGAGALAIALAGVDAASSNAHGTRCVHTNARPGSATADQLRKAVVCLVNHARANHGVAGLSQNADLDDLATGHTKTMLKQNCFTHQCHGEPSLRHRFRSSPYVKGTTSFRYAEELGYESTPRQMVVRWLKIPGDRANLLDKHLKDIGVGPKRGSPKPGVKDRRFVTYTVDLGTRIIAQRR